MRSRAFSTVWFSLKLRSLFCLLCGLGLILTHMTQRPLLENLVPSAQAATSIERPKTPISTIKFDVGRLEQDMEAYGQWTEYDFRGIERYRFREISSDNNTLRLIGMSGKVTLLVDFKAKTISGEWEGHPMAKLYTILDIDNMAFAQISPPKTSQAEPVPNTLQLPVTSAPVISAPATSNPSVTPPEISAPLISPSPEPESVMAGPAPIIVPPTRPSASKFSVKNVTQAEFKNGSYIKKRGLDWIETTSDNHVFELRQIGRNKNSIFLYDSARNLFIELDLRKRVARSSEGGRLKKRHKLRDIFEEFPIKSPAPNVPEIMPTPELTSEPTPPIVQAPSNRLSIKARFECRKNGGFIERAGLLGAERCTHRYSDGGNVCLDSQDCQGKCMTTTNAGKKNVSGKCQMTDNPFGCRAEVINGEADFMLCVD